MTAPRAPGARPAIVLLSGGIDSTVALAWALHEGMAAVPLLVRFPGQPGGERRAARAVAEAAGLALRIADAPWLEAPRDASPQGYIPHRNLVLYAIAGHVAARLGASAVVGGHNAEDVEGFPDARPAFLARVERLLAEGTPEGRGPRILLPLAALTKRDVVRLGRGLKAPFHLTWSCYRPRRRPCGACAACVERAAAMR